MTMLLQRYKDGSSQLTFEEGISVLVHKWGKCINPNDTNLEKKHIIAGNIKNGFFIVINRLASVCC